MVKKSKQKTKAIFGICCNIFYLLPLPEFLFPDSFLTLLLSELRVFVEFEVELLELLLDDPDFVDVSELLLVSVFLVGGGVLFISVVLPVPLVVVVPLVGFVSDGTLS